MTASTVDMLDGLSDAVLNRTFAEELAGWRDIRPNPIAALYHAGFNDREGKTEVANGGSPWGIPDFSLHADAVLPWLEQYGPYVSAEIAGQKWHVIISDFDGNQRIGRHHRFARAACVALLRTVRKPTP